MIKQPFQMRDAINPHYMSLVVEVGRLVRKVSESTGIGNDAIILEDFGHTLTQKDWTDETGYFVTFRPHPLYSHLDRVKEALKVLENRFIASFKPLPGKPAHVTVEQPWDQNSKITVAVVSDVHSIGD